MLDSTAVEKPAAVSSGGWCGRLFTGTDRRGNGRGCRGILPGDVEEPDATVLDELGGRGAGGDESDASFANGDFLGAKVLPGIGIDEGCLLYTSRCV